MSDEDAARQDFETAARSVVRADELPPNGIGHEWVARGLGFLVFGMIIEVSILFTLVFTAITFFLQPAGPNDITRTYEIAAIVLAVGISIAAFYNRNRLRYQGRSANIVVAAVELFKPLLFTAFFILATLLLQFPLFVVYFLRLCFQRLGLSLSQDWLEQHAWLICTAFLLIGLLSMPVIYLYRLVRRRASTTAKDRGESSLAPTLAEIVWSAEAALTGPAMFAFVGFIVTVSAMIALGGRP
jgi:hypothetical protein